jgi:hypothetical protein
MAGNTKTAKSTAPSWAQMKATQYKGGGNKPATVQSTAQVSKGKMSGGKVGKKK